MTLPMLAASLVEEGRPLKLRLAGNSMPYSIPDGSEIIVDPNAEVVPGHVYLYLCQEALIAHRLVRIYDRSDERVCVFLGEKAGSEYEEIPLRVVLARVSSVIYGGRSYDLAARFYRLVAYLWRGNPRLARCILRQWTFIPRLIRWVRRRTTGLGLGTA